jgi:hypothetical protein
MSETPNNVRQKLMRLASVVNQANRPTRIRHGAGVFSVMADSTRKNRDASLFAWGAAVAMGTGRLVQSVIRQSKIDSIS